MTTALEEMDRPAFTLQPSAGAQVDKLLARIEAIETRLAAIEEKPRVLAEAVERILRVVGNHYDVSKEQILSTSRLAGFVWGRHLSIYLAMKLHPITLQECAAQFGCGISNITNARRRVESDLKNYPLRQAEVAKLLAQLRDPKE
jgi:chromosomal replication initiation ATPase DnaA